MRRLLIFLTTVAAISGTALEFFSLPKSVKLPSPSTVSELRLSQLSQLNENLLGLSAKPVRATVITSSKDVVRAVISTNNIVLEDAVECFGAETDLFSRPRAIAIVRVDGVSSLNQNNHVAYKLEGDVFDLSALNEQLSNLFGADRETVIVTNEGFTGSEIARIAAKQKVDDEVIKTKDSSLRAELVQVYQLAAAITLQKVRFEKSSTADIYQVTISSLGKQKLSEEEYAVAVKDVQRAVEKLANALTTVYGDQAIVEVVAVSDYINPVLNRLEDSLVRRKRAATMNTDTALKTWREALNVYVFVSTDYPAIFAIFAGLTIALVLAVLYAVVGMMSMDPSRDSIIYRMTTTRMKKA